MFDRIREKLIKGTINWLLKMKEVNPKEFDKGRIKNQPKVLKKLDSLYKRITLMDMFLEAVYGLDSQIYIDFHDKLNILSLDKDREDSLLK